MENLNLLPEISEKCDVILAQIMKAKADMGTTVKKDSTNPFHKSKYASLGAHLELTEPVLLKHGLLLLPSANMINNQNILIATLFHVESGQWIKSYLPLPNPKADSQGIGASLTYMRRYAINSMFSLNAEDDDGETASGRGKYEKQNAKENNAPAKKGPELVERLGKPEIIAITSLIQKLDQQSNKSFLDWIRKKFSASSLNDIPKSSYEECTILLNAKIKYLNDKNKQNQQQQVAVS